MKYLQPYDDGEDKCYMLALELVDGLGQELYTEFHSYIKNPIHKHIYTIIYSEMYIFLNWGINRNLSKCL